MMRRSHDGARCSVTSEPITPLPRSATTQTGRRRTGRKPTSVCYATMHPWEDWAETFAHYLHIRDTLQTAGAFGLLVAGPEPLADPALASVPEVAAGQEQPIESVIDSWLPLTYALNAVNRSLGLGDLYPFTLAPVVIEKLGYVHEQVLATVSRWAYSRG